MVFEDLKTPCLDEGVRQKVTDDENLAELKKIEVLTSCLNARDEAEAESAFDDYAELNRFAGLQVVELEATSYTGHIKLLNAVTWYLSKTLNESPESDIEYSPAEVNERIIALALPGNPLRKKEALIWFEEEVFDLLPAYTVAGRPTWLFEEDEGDARTLLSSPERVALPCRLGLPEPKLWGDPPHTYPRGLEFVGFAFAGGVVEGPKRPTALDGCYDSVKKIWIIGGRSAPLPHGPDEMKSLGGLQELVAEPPLLSNTIGNVYVFKN